MRKLDYRWTALALLWVAFFLQQGTRQLFGPSVPAICSSLGVDQVTVGVVGTVFSMVYGLCVPFAGIAADLLSRKWMVAAGVAIFSAGIFVSGLVASVGLLIAAYGVINGLGQTFYYPPATSLVSQLHRESRATAMSILQLGLYSGIIGCGTLAGLVAGKGGESWRSPFLVFGAIGIAWSVVLAIFLRDTRTVAVSVGGERPSVGEALRAVFSKPTAICIILGLAMWVYVDVGFKVWMPAFLLDHYLGEFPSLSHWFGFHAVVWHYLGAIAGIVVFSRIGDTLAKGRPTIRLELEAAGLACAVPFIVWMAYATSFVQCCVAMTLFGFFRGIYDSNFVASFFEVVDPRYHSSGVGIMMCIAFLFGSLSSTVLPGLARALGGDMARSMSTLAAFYLVGAVIVFVSRIRFFAKDRIE